MKTTLDCRAWVLSTARLADYPEVALRQRTIPAGEAAWREFVKAATYFDLGRAERALNTRREEAEVARER